MIILKDNEVTSNVIKIFRKKIMVDTKEVKKFLGINSRNIVERLPIKNRDFNIWAIKEKDSIIGFVSFKTANDITFIKTLYIVKEHRKKGYAKKLLLKLNKQFDKLETQVNKGNTAMYKMLESIGFKGKESRLGLGTDLNTKPILWSNYKL